MTEDANITVELTPPNEITEAEEAKIIEFCKTDAVDPRSVAGRLIDGTLHFVRLSGSVTGYMLVERKDSTLWVWVMHGDGLTGNAQKLWAEVQAVFRPYGFSQVGLRTNRAGLAKLFRDELGWQPTVYWFEEKFDDIESRKVS